MEITVLHFSWAYEDESFAGGPHTINGEECECGAKHKPTKALVEGIAAAADCPDPPVEILVAPNKLLPWIKGAVQSQEDGEAAYAKAQADGSWQVGNVISSLERQQARIEQHEESIKQDSLEGRLSDDDYARAQFALKQTQQVAAMMDDGLSFDEAAEKWHDDLRAEQEARARAGE